MPLLTIHNLCASIENKPILQGIDLIVNAGEIHAIMGPNGSGKSTLANVLMGHPSYKVTDGSVQYCDEDLLAMTTDERAKKGLFLAFQYPKEIAGVTLRSFLFAAYKAKRPDEKISPVQFKKLLLAQMETLKMDPSFAERYVNKGFSGGEKKKAEILQLNILKPSLALLDETDSGLDIDALKIVAEGVQTMLAPDFSAIIVTHYARILGYLTPDKVHVMVDGKIAESGGADLARKLEEKGYAEYGDDAPKIALV